MVNNLTTSYEFCPICGHREFRPLRSSDCSGYPLYREPLPRVLNWVQCQQCGHVFTDCHYTEEGFRFLFDLAHPNQVAGGDYDRQRFVWSDIVERVIRLHGESEMVPEGAYSWLDVGCGNGGLVFTAAEYGFEAHGLDIREEAVASMKAFGYNAHCGNILSVDLDRQVDVISLADVLEHLPFPLLVVERVHQLLKPSGILVVSCPNMECVTWKAMDREGQNPYWSELEHHHNFTRSLLTSVLEACLFQPLSYGVSKRYKACMEIYASKSEEENNSPASTADVQSDL